MKIRRMLAAVVASLCVSQASYAVVAYPGVIKAKQADGTEISIRLHGDEHGHYTTTEDGYPLYFNEVTNNYEYATVVNGAIKSSGIVAMNSDKRTATANAFLKTVDKEAYIDIQIKLRNAKLEKFNAAQRKLLAERKGANGPSKILINDFPHTGEQHSVVILVQFKDKAFSTVDDPLQYYTDALNKEGFTASNGANGSARDYFIASSNGVFKPTFDVYGPVTVNYNQFDAGNGDDFSQGSINVMDIIEDAVKQLDATVDFSQYDHDKDGYVDNIYMFYAGTGAADDINNRKNVIWPHAYNFSYVGRKLDTNDGVGINSYTCSNEVDGLRQTYPAGIGTFVHEFGHCLGLCDHYDVNNKITAYTPGYWDAMAQGSYNNNSNTPPLYSSYEKYELGWIDPEVITNSTKGELTLPNLGDSNKAYKANVAGKDNEYFLFENRQRIGWDAYLPASGMLVWHIDMDENIWKSNTVNTVANHQRVDIVEANGIPSGQEMYASGVPFPGSSNVTSNTFKSWAGNVVFNMDKAKIEDGVASFIAKGSDAVLTKPEVSVSNISYDSFICSWNAVEDAEEYNVNVAKVNGDGSTTPLADYTDKKVDDATSLTVKGLEQDTQYELRVSSCAGAFSSEEASTKISTIVKPFTAYKVSNVKSNDITASSFTATWDALDTDEVQDYIVTLANESYDGETATTEYDFTNKKPGLPYGWKTNATTCPSTDGCYGKDAPSLQLSANGHYLIMENKDAQISHIEFWMKPSKLSETATLSVHRMNGLSWEEVAVISLDNADGKVYAYDFDPTNSVRLYFKRTGTEKVYIDDVAISGNSIKRTPLANYNEKSVGKVTTYDFIGLQPDTKYILTVRGVSNGVKTEQSDDIVVYTSNPTGIDGIKTNESDSREMTYDLTGRLVGEKSQKVGGIYIVKKGGKTRKTVK